MSAINAAPDASVATEERPLLDVRQLKTTFLTPRGDVVACENIDLTLRAGETLGVVGESGSGKSVLSRSVMGILSDSRAIRRSGEIYFDGIELVGRPRQASRRLWGSQMGMVLQDPLTSLNPVTKVGRQLVETIRRHHPELSKREAYNRGVELLRSVGIPAPDERMKVYPHHISGGMRQRVGIAIALAGDPRLLFADEPTTALDVTIQRQILDLLLELKEERQMAMLLVTHDLGVVATRTDRIIVMYAGRVVEEAPTRSLFAQVRMPYTRALIDALPARDTRAHSRLKAIPGHPPNLARPGVGCRFASRCVAATDKCRIEEPPLTSALDHEGHRYRCWHPVGSEHYERAAAAAAEVPIVNRSQR